MFRTPKKKRQETGMRREGDTPEEGCTENNLTYFIFSELGLTRLELTFAIHKWK
jgi:hypothetical protein